jgi:hypothetical protein
MLYTDGTTPATLEQVEEERVALIAADKLAEREANASEVQEFIDTYKNDPADADYLVRLSNAKITATPDDKDSTFVVINFDPVIIVADTAEGGVCRGSLAVITKMGTADTPKREAVGATGFRCSKGDAIKHLMSISTLL